MTKNIEGVPTHAHANPRDASTMHTNMEIGCPEGEGNMAATVNALYGTTSESGSVPGVGNAGPVYSDDGRLIIGESFTKDEGIWDLTAFAAKISWLLSGDDYVESWQIWDCYEQDWADVRLELHRFEMYDLVIKVGPEGICTWRGAIDTYGRVMPSRDPEEDEANCWQWLRCQ